MHLITKNIHFTSILQAQIYKTTTHLSSYFHWYPGFDIRECTIHTKIVSAWQTDSTYSRKRNCSSQIAPRYLAAQTLWIVIAIVAINCREIPSRWIQRFLWWRIGRILFWMENNCQRRQGALRCSACDVTQGALPIDISKLFSVIEVGF